MLELLTLYRHADHMETPDYHFDDGQVMHIETVKNPEYSDKLRELIRKCVEPNPLDRIKLKDLRSRIKSGRSKRRQFYRRKSEGVRERIRAHHRLYYVRNEINDMPPGNFEPQQVIPPSWQSEGFDHEFPIKYPRFPDGPEGREAEGHRFSNPIVLSDGDDLANENNDGSDIGSRKEGRPRPVGKDESSSNGRRPLDRDLGVAAGGRSGVRDYDDDDGTDDEEVDMDLEVEEPPSPPLPDDLDR